MKNSRLLAAATVALLAVGCAVDNGSAEGEMAGKTKMKFSAAATETRTTLNTDNSVAWSADDLLSVFGTADTDNNPFALVSGSGAATGTFEGTITAGSTQYWAIYPFDASNSFDLATQTLSLTLPQTQSYATDSFATDVNPMAAVGSGSSLAFKNLCGLLQIELTGNVTVSQLLIYDASGMPLAGTAEVTFADGTPTVTMTESNSLPVVIDCGTSGVTLSSTPTIFYAVVPPRSFTDGFQLIVIDTENDSMVTNIAATSVSRASIRSLGTLTYTVEEVVHYGQANSYQYTATASAQTASIDVTPYSTTQSALISTIEANTSYNAAGANIIWQDNASLVSNVALSGTTLTATIAPSQTGNALIGITDSNGNNVWSFHIWVTESDIENDSYSNGYTLMDRALGAVADSSSGTGGGRGLYYQWGRKDPFRNTTNTTVAGPQTIAYSIANPTTFITATSVESWYVDDYISLWGNPFGYTALPETQYIGHKTIFDPCPAGYQVAPPAAFADFGSANFVWSSAGGATSSLTDGGAWYSAMGFLTSTGGAISGLGSSGAYWANSPFDYFDYTNSLSYIGSCALSYSNTMVSGNDWYPAAAGVGVRCMLTP